MKNLHFCVLACLSSMLLVCGCNSQEKKEIENLNKKIKDLNEQVAPLPASLDKYYPPQSDQPVYLLKMYSLNAFLTGTLVDIQENDMSNALANFEKFKAAYAEISQMVPEWNSLYPADPLTALGTALSSGDPAKIMPAFESVGAVCHKCHTSFMADMMFKYHWDSFHAFQIPDPFNNGDIDISRLMQYLNAGMTGIVNNMEQGQKDQALKQFQAFNTSFQALKGSCGLCHETDRAYFVDQNVQTMVDNLGAAIGNSDVDMGQIMELTQAIGMESCFKCHLVHVPASLFINKLELQQRTVEK